MSNYSENRKKLINNQKLQSISELKIRSIKKKILALHDPRIENCNKIIIFKNDLNDNYIIGDFKAKLFYEYDGKTILPELVPYESIKHLFSSKMYNEINNNKYLHILNLGTEIYGESENEFDKIDDIEQNVDCRQFLNIKFESNQYQSYLDAFGTTGRNLLDVMKNDYPNEVTDLKSCMLKLRELNENDLNTNIMIGDYLEITTLYDNTSFKPLSFTGTAYSVDKDLNNRVPEKFILVGINTYDNVNGERNRGLLFFSQNGVINAPYGSNVYLPTGTPTPRSNTVINGIKQNYSNYLIDTSLSADKQDIGNGAFCKAISSYFENNYVKLKNVKRTYDNYQHNECVFVPTEYEIFGNNYLSEYDEPLNTTQWQLFKYNNMNLCKKTLNSVGKNNDINYVECYWWLANRSSEILSGDQKKLLSVYPAYSRQAFIGGTTSNNAAVLAIAFYL